MRLHGAAAFILSRGMGPSSNHEMAMDVNRVPPVPAIISSRNMAPALHMVDPTLTNQVAGAFNNMNDDMMKGDDQALKALEEISASFKKLAASDFSSLFQATNQAAASAPPVASVAPSLPVQANVQPAIPLPAVPPPVTPPPADVQPSKSIPSYVASLKKSAQYGSTGTTAPPAATSSGPASYMDSLSSAAGTSKAAPVTGPGMGAQTSYLNALQPPQRTQRTQKSYPTTATSSASSYLDSMTRSASMSPANGPTMNYPIQDRYQPPRQETYAPPPPQQTFSQPPPQQAYETYAPPPPQQTYETYAPPPPQQTYAPPPQAQMPPPQAQMPPPQAQMYPPQSFPPQVFPPQAQGQPVYAQPPPQAQQPVYSQPPPPQAQPVDQLLLEEPPVNRQQRVAKRAEVLDFGLDNVDLMSAGSAPRIETPPPRSSMSQNRMSVAGTKVSGYIPAMQGLGMSGHAQNVPDPQPKPAMNISPFSKRVAGYENGMMEQQQAPAQPRPPMPMSPFATKMSGLDGMSDQAPQVPTPKPKPPMSVFSKKISGLDGMSERAPDVPQPKPKPPMPVFSQKISGIMSDMERMQATGGARMAPEPQELMSVAGRKVSGIPTYSNGATQNNHYNDGWAEKPSQPMSVFSKKVNGIMPDNNDMANSNRGGAPRPEQPMSVFGKRINSNVPRVVANSGDTFSGGSGYVPEPHPMEYARPSQAQAVAPGFALDHQDSLAAGSAPHVPSPPPTGSSGWENYPPHSRRSFQMNPDSSW